MDSASQSAKETVLACIAGLEASGFVRPSSLSPDAYLAALSDLSKDWAPELGTLASAYATLRFGGGTIAVDRSAIVAAAEAIARRTDSLNRSGEIATMQDAWRTRYPAPIEPAEDASTLAPAVPAISANSSFATEDALRASLPTPTPDPVVPPLRRFDLSQFRLGESNQFVRRLSETSISLRTAATVLVIAGAVGAIGAYYLPECVRLVGLAFESRSTSDPVGLRTPSVVIVSPPLAPLASNEAQSPMFPQLYSPSHPHAGVFNDVIAETLSELASLHRGIGDFERAETIYAYVADSLPSDFVAQREYATYLLNPDVPELRDVYRACAYAERAYDLNPRDARTVQTFTDALFANGDASRAVEIQQRWLDQERQADIASHVEEHPTADRSSG